MVVVADDCPVARLVLARELGKRGIDATYVASVATARALEAAITCALTDLDLGDGSGTELAEHLRSRAPTLPVAFFTGSTDTSDARRLGPVFRKPEELEQALDWVERHAAMPSGGPRDGRR